MNILITGGNGFIAKNLSENLSYKYKLFICNRIDLDLLDQSKVFDYFKEKKIDVVIHTATYDAAPKHSTKDYTKVLEYNLKMFFNIVRCNDLFGKMIYFGSGAEFDREFWQPKMKEDYFEKHIPTDQYGFSKYIMTKYTQSHKNIYNLRLFGLYGKYDDWRTRLIPNVCYQAITNKKITIDQNKFYDFLFINDLIRIVDWFIKNEPKTNIYNICSGRVIDFETVVNKIIKISGKKLILEIKNNNLGKEYSGDNTLFLNELEEFKFTPIDKGLKSLYSWYDKNRKEYFK